MAAITPLRRKPLRCNLLRDGFEGAAEHVSKVLRATKGAHVVQVDADGAVRVRARCRFDDADLDLLVVLPTYVGIFTRAARIEHIEDSLLERQRAMAAEAA